MTNKKALILVDLQNDFCEGGSLAVPEGDKVISLANQLQTCFEIVVATQDWHPEDHVSFASNHPGKKPGDYVQIKGEAQVLWPAHCIQDSRGAQLHPQLNKEKITRIFYKGTDKNIDSYSAFFDNAHLRSTGLENYLRESGVTQVYLSGLATDYCVKYSALDAKNLGFEVFVITDATRGVELHAGDIKAALQEMQDAGINLITATEAS